MSEHTKGRLHQCSHSDKRLRDESGAWVADTDTLRRSESECSANARRLNACWNNAEGMSTKEIEQGMPLAKIRDKINEQARELSAARALIQQQDALLGQKACATKECRELLDARALLRELIKQEEDGDVVLHAKFSNRVISHLDACDTLEGKPNAG